MSKWLTVQMLQSRPFDMGMLDQNQRAIFAFNFMATKVPSEQFEEEVMSILVAAGVGVFGTNMFGATKSEIPNGDGPFLSVISTGGPAGIRTQNVAGVAYEQATAQVAVCAGDAVAARGMAWAAFNAIAPVVNQAVVAA